MVRAEIVQCNVRRLAEYARFHGLRIRPHTKTHKSRKLARLQLEAGATGLTVAKAGEAEQMAMECEDLLVAYPAVDPARCTRLARLARDCTVRVAVDSTTAVENLSAAAISVASTIGLLVDIDVGMGRTGVATPEDALELARAIASTKGVRLDGLFYYPGHIWAAADQQGRALAEVSARLEEVIDLWRTHGFESPIVSGGSTPTAFQSHLIKPGTEIRPGTYIFNDMNTVRGGFCTLDDCAAAVVCTVVSTAVKNQIVLDGGSKTFTSDRCIPAPESGHGHLMEYSEARLTQLSEEHCQVDVSLCASRPKIGERVTVIPNHICPCVNLQDAFYWQEAKGDIERVTVDARGKLS